MDRIIVALSGGLDSAVLLAEAVERIRLNGMDGSNLVAYGFYYGSKHNVYENQAAMSVAANYNVCFQVLDLSNAMKGFQSDLLRSGGAIPEGHYADESMKQTVVPARNMIFASILAGIAESRQANQVWLGIHAGDHAIYPDCRPDFFSAMRQAIRYATDCKVQLVAPFLHQKKDWIVRRGLELNVPFSCTRTCYKDQPVACGRCGSCRERLEAFQLNGKPDPIPYENQAA